MTRALALLGWGLLAAAVAAWLVTVQVFWLPLRVGPVPVPLSLVAAVVGNVLLVSWAHRLSGSRVVGVVPAVVWLVIAVRASLPRPEGDLLIAGATTATQLTGLGFLLVGVLAAAFAVGRVLIGGAVPAGSGSGGAR